MITIKNITIKNFMSVGQVTQSINLENRDLVLVLGENLDLGGNDSRNGVGKAQPLHSKIKTPNGWTTMGDISVGDLVTAHDGNSVKVLGTFPQGVKDIYRLTFSDGRTVEACGDHLWKVFSHSFPGDKFKVITTKEIIAHNEKYSRHKNKSTYYKYVPMFQGDKKENISLPLDPYFLGAMLGDGSFSKNGYVFTTSDQEVADRVSRKLPVYLDMFKDSYSSYGYRFKHKKQPKFSLFTKDLKDLGLYGRLSDTKFIPEIYRESSVDQKLELLRGLVDTDGYVGKQGCVSITTVSEQLAKDIQYIVRSIGGQAKIALKTNCGYKNERDVFIKCKDAYTVSIMYHTPKDLATVERKVALLPGEDYQYNNRKLRIDNIEYIGDMEAKCIMIDHPDHLYITDGFTVTHNSTILNALSYALYGVALTNIKKNNLINLTNGKNMVVTLEFEKDGVEYFVERGRSPNRFVFSVAGKEFQSEDSDEAQGDSRLTQIEIERHLGLSHQMFKLLVALNTYSEPFLSMRSGDQRAIIEQLLGITQLSEKAEVLKGQLKETKDAIKEEEFRIGAVKEANKRIEDNILTLKAKSNAWINKHEKLLHETAEAIVTLQDLDVEAEIAAHKKRAEVIALKMERDGYERSLRRHETARAKEQRLLDKALADLAAIEDQACPTCGHGLDDEKHQALERDARGRVSLHEAEIAEHDREIDEALANMSRIVVEDLPDTFYTEIEEAYNHRSSLDNLMDTLEKESLRENPHLEQIKTLEESGIQEVSFEKINELTVLRDHQDFLFKLLTSKDSFIRRKIIDQNLAFLNARLESYLEKIGLPHSVRFQSDLSVEIQEHGRDLDFDNLSRGERTRLILSLSWAFRDVYESLNTPISLLFIDELIDNGLDSAGVESALSVLKKMARDGKRNIFLISHRDELVGRVNSVLRVVKEGGFTSFSEEVE